MAVSALPNYVLAQGKSQIEKEYANLLFND